jgi:hypothetical protein
VCREINDYLFIIIIKFKHENVIKMKNKPDPAL